MDTLSQSIYQEIFPAPLSKSEQRRLQIIDAAIGLYATRGLGGGSFEAIASRCRITRRLVQHYFSDQETLLLASAKYVRGIFQKLAIDCVQKEIHPDKQLAAYVDSTFIWIKRYETHAKFWPLVYFHCGLSKDFYELNSELVRMGQVRIEGLLAVGKEKGVFRCPEVAVAAKMIQIIITGALVTALSEKSSMSLPVLQKQTLKLCFEVAGLR